VSDPGEEKLPFELEIPGTSVTIDGRPDADVMLAIQSIIANLSEAAMALLLFEEIPMFRQLPPARETIETNSAEKAEIKKRLESERGEHDPNDRVARAKLDLEVDRCFLRVSFAKGEIPDDFHSQRHGLLAKAFLFAINNIANHMGVLDRHPRLPKPARGARNRFYKAFPKLEGMRDSAAHPEDRIRGVKKGDEPIPRPEEGPFMLFFGSFHGTQFTMTTAAGHHAQLDISWTTIATARDHIQQLLNALTWDGAATIYPRIGWPTR
jgi:hypothetical protein